MYNKGKRFFMNYNPAIFGELLDSNAMRGMAALNMDSLMKLGDIICEYGLSDIVGVTLVHRHHTLSDDERLVWNVCGDRWEAAPTRSFGAGIIPTRWKMGSNPNEIFPLEFLSIRDSNTPEVDVAKRVLENVPFLEAFRSKACELGVQDTFGLGILQTRKKFNLPGMTMFEESNLQERTTSAWMIPESKVPDLTGGVTLWNFTPDSINANQACAHGNSAHCCGG